MEATLVRLGNEDGNHIFLELQEEYSLSSRKSHQARVSLVEFVIGKFGGSVKAIIGLADLHKLLENCMYLYENLTGHFFFLDAANEIFEFELSGDGLGHIKVSGHIYDSPGSPSKLDFSFAIDQTQLKVVADDLRKALATQ